VVSLPNQHSWLPFGLCSHSKIDDFLSAVRRRVVIHNGSKVPTWVDSLPPRRIGQFWKGRTPGNLARNESLRLVKYLGRTHWKKWRGYHRRSLVETKMRCFKLLADRVMARDFDRQVAELQICAAILNYRVGHTANGTDGISTPGVWGN